MTGAGFLTPAGHDGGFAGAGMDHGSRHSAATTARAPKIRIIS